MDPAGASVAESAVPRLVPRRAVRQEGRRERSVVRGRLEYPEHRLAHQERPERLLGHLGSHSGCRRADIELRIEGAWLVLTVRDDGKGLDVSLASQGNGLLSMRRRAKGLGGKLDIASYNGKGTTLTLRIPHSVQRLRIEGDRSLQ